MRDFSVHPKLRVAALTILGVGTTIRGIAYLPGSDVLVLTYVDGLIPIQLWSIVWIGTGISILLGIWHRYLARYALNISASLWLVWSVSYLLSWITDAEGPRYWVTAASMATLSGVMYIVAALMDQTGPPPGSAVPKVPDKGKKR